MKNQNTLIMGANILLSSLFFVSCSQPEKQETPRYEITANIAHTSMDSAYLSILDVDGWKVIDSVAKTEQGFVFSGEVKSPEFAKIGNKENSYSVSFFLDNNKIQLFGDFELPQSDSIVGAETNTEYLAVSDSINVFDTQLKSIVDEYNAHPEPGDSVLRKSLEERYNLSTELKHKWILEWVKSHPESAISEFLLINPLMYRLTTEELKELFNAISPEVQSNGLYAIISERLQIMENSAVGKLAPDFVMADTLGVDSKLSAHFGSYLLIDFWASWCGPCREENPNMVRIYNRFHEMGYDVLGVSLDQSKDRWIKAIKADNLTWAHVSDLKGWKNAAAKIYGVRSIPHTVLLDPNGIILARGLRGEELELKLEEIFTQETP